MLHQDLIINKVYQFQKMKSVYTFLKEYKQLRESETSERAAELGYEWQRRNVYVDPKSGKRYRGTGTKFEEIPDEQPAEKKPGQQAPQKTLDKFKKDAQERPAVAPQTPQPSSFPANPVDDGQEAEMRAVAASQGLWPRYTDARKDYHINRELQQIQADREAAQAELEAQQQPEPQPEPQVEEPPKKEPEEFRTIDQVIVDQRAEEGKNFDNSINLYGFDVATEESIKRVGDISNTDVNDERFESGRQSQKQFLEHYSKDSEFRPGLNTLNKYVAKSNDRTKVNEMMDAINSGDYLRTINLKKGTDVTVSQLLLDVGIDVNNQEQLNCFRNAYEDVNSFIGDYGEFKTSESHTLTGNNLGYFEAKHISERNDLEKLDPSGIQVKAFNLRNESQSSTQCVTPVITDAVFSLLPQSSRNFLNTSGSPKTHYDPTKEGGQGTANNIRGSALLHMWYMQDGRDVYSLSGVKSSPGEFEAEHVTPLKSGGIDSIENFAMALRRTNRARADLSHQKLVEQSKRRSENIDFDLSNPKTREESKIKLRSSQLNKVIKGKLGGEISSLFGSDVLEDLNSNLEKSLGRESQSIKLSQEEYQKYQNEISIFLEENGISSNTRIQDMSPDQINNVFDIMNNNLGLDKSKGLEYWGRNVINNGDLGARTLMDRETGQMVRGRSGTEGTPKSMLSLQNSILLDDRLTPEEKNREFAIANKNHQILKKTRNSFIDNSQNSNNYEDFLGSIVESLKHLRGGDDGSSLNSERKYDNRLTYSEGNNPNNDIFSTITSLLTLDSKSISDGTNTFSPSFQQNPLTPKAREHLEYLRDMMTSAYASSKKGFTVDEILNPDSLNKTRQKNILPFTTAISEINKALSQ